MKGVFLWKVRPGMEAEFERRWTLGSQRWQRKAGARGTQMHKGAADSTLYLGYATWESLAHRQRAEETMRAEAEAQSGLREAEDTATFGEFTPVGFFDEPHQTVMPQGISAGQS